MSDIARFLQDYREKLRRGLAAEDMPPELIEQFSFESLEEKKGHFEVYGVTRRSDGKRGVLQISSAGCAGITVIRASVPARPELSAVPTILASWNYKGRNFLVLETEEHPGKTSSDKNRRNLPG